MLSTNEEVRRLERRAERLSERLNDLTRRPWFLGTSEAEHELRNELQLVDCELHRLRMGQ